MWFVLLVGGVEMGSEGEFKPLERDVDDVGGGVVECRRYILVGLDLGEMMDLEN